MPVKQQTRGFILVAELAKIDVRCNALKCARRVNVDHLLRARDRVRFLGRSHHVLHEL